MNIEQQILLNILALDKAFADFEFIHAYLGPQELKKQARTIRVRDAYTTLKELRFKLDENIDDDPPLFRRTYIADLLESVLAQTEHFVFHLKTQSFKATVARMLGCNTCSAYDLEAAFAGAEAEIQALGFGSIREFQAQRKTTCFATPQELRVFVRQCLKELTRQVFEVYAPIFDFDLGRLLKQSRMHIVSAGPEGPPCFYCYRGQNRGTVGLEPKKAFSKAYLQNFISHEVMPGHHFYYLIKEAVLAQNPGCALMAIDTYFAPENIINEGLAVNADLLLPGFGDASCLALLKVEKFLHKLFHNAWHAVNIDGRPVDRSIHRLLKCEIGFSDEDRLSRLKYFTQDARFYTPCYAHGIHYVEQFLQRHGKPFLPLMYGQHSVNTLKKVATLYGHSSSKKPLGVSRSGERHSGLQFWNVSEHGGPECAGP